MVTYYETKRRVKNEAFSAIKKSMQNKEIFNYQDWAYQKSFSVDLTTSGIIATCLEIAKYNRWKHDDTNIYPASGDEAEL